MKHHSSLINLGLVFAILLACKGSGDLDSSRKPGGDSGKKSSSELYGYWFYTQAESEGSTTSASGHLTLNDDDTFEDSRYLAGNNAGYRTGTFSVSGDMLTLKDERSGSQTFTFHVGAARDADNQNITTLTLKGSGLSYLLTKKK